MNRRLLVAGMLALIASPLAAQQFAPADIVERDYQELLALLPGVYNNQEQVYFQGEIGQPEAQRRPRLHLVVTRLSPLTDGQSLFHAALTRGESTDSDPVVTHQIWEWSLGPDGWTISQRVHQADGLPADVAPEQLTSPSCQVGWRRAGAQFSGSGNCPGQTHWLLSEPSLWIGSPEPAASAAAYVDYARLHRARSFTCWAGVQRRDTDAGMYFKSDLNIHDQGGWIHLVTDETPPQRVSLKMRNVIWPYGRGRHSRVLYAHRENLERAESYAWTEPATQRIAINLRWVQASCTAVEKTP